MLQILFKDLNNINVMFLLDWIQKLLYAILSCCSVTVVNFMN